MAQRVAAIFSSRDAAERAADALVDLGAERDHISTLTRGDDGTVATPTTRTDGMRAGATTAADHRPETDVVEPARVVGDAGAPLTTAEEGDAAHGAATGAAIGAAAGIALAAVALLVPGFGPVLASGPLAWAIGGIVGTTVGGAIAGGVYGSLRDIGIDESYARTYEERLRTGDVLLTAVLPSSLSEDRVLDVLSEHGAEDVSFSEDTAPARGTFTAPETTTARTDRDYTIPGATTMPAERDYTGTPTTTTTAVGAAGYGSNVARGEAKQVEGEIRDRDAAYTGSLTEKLEAKGEKAAGKVQEAYGRATDRTVRADTDEVRVPIREEQAQVRKESRQTGEVAVRKETEVETQHISTPVTETRVVAERRPVPPGQQYNPDPGATTLREGEEIRVPVVEEQVRVEKVPRVTEEVVLHKQQQTRQVEQDVPVRRERVQLEEEGDVDVENADTIERRRP